MTIDWGALTAPCRDAFGEAVTYTPQTGAPFAINGVYDDAYVEVTAAGDGSAVTSTFPVLGVLLSDFPSPPLQGDQYTVTRTGETLVVKEVRPDSHGWAILRSNLLSG